MSYIDKQVVEIKKDNEDGLYRIGVYKHWYGRIDVNIYNEMAPGEITLTKREARTLMKGLQKAIQKRKR